jgi:hypothetical protein
LEALLESKIKESSTRPRGKGGVGVVAAARPTRRID